MNEEQQEMMQRDEQDAWQVFQRNFWPRVAQYSARANLHSRLLKWLVGGAFKAGIEAGIKIGGNVTLREFDFPTVFKLKP